MSDWPSFEKLFEMAEHQPDALEAFRQKEVAALIESAPEDMQHRLRGLQFQIDCQRKLHPTPVGACIAISKMMHESLGRLHRALHSLHAENAENEPQAPPKQSSADVIPFPAAS